MRLKNLLIKSYNFNVNFFIYQIKGPQGAT